MCESNEDMFYMLDSRSSLGGSGVFWGEKGGYHTDLENLSLWTREDAQKQHNCRSSDVPLLKSMVDICATIRVDHQYIPEPVSINDIHENVEYVIQLAGSYSGNDILFLCDGDWAYTYEKAVVLKGILEVTAKINKFGKDIGIFKKEDMDKASRKVIPIDKINRGTMATKKGIKLAKRKRIRKTSGKFRSNCPSCGRLVWDYNPHESAYCSHH